MTSYKHSHIVNLQAPLDCIAYTSLFVKLYNDCYKNSIVVEKEYKMDDSNVRVNKRNVVLFHGGLELELINTQVASVRSKIFSNLSNLIESAEVSLQVK